jgi:hypothetical protein
MEFKTKGKMHVDMTRTRERRYETWAEVIGWKLWNDIKELGEFVTYSYLQEDRNMNQSLVQHSTEKALLNKSRSVSP